MKTDQVASGKITESTRTMERDGDRMIIKEVIITTRPAVVDYNEILEKCRVEPDDFSEAPWDNCDGYKHEAVYRPLDSSRFEDAALEHMRGYTYSEGNNCRVLIVPQFDDPYEDYEYFRVQGCSKQVARENVAMMVRMRLDQLVKWYSKGWEWYGVQYEDDDYNESIWGIDDYDCAYKEVRHEIASQVVYLMEKDGYTVINKPERKTLLNRNTTPEQQKDRYRRNIHLFDVSDDKDRVGNFPSGFSRWVDQLDKKGY